MKIYVLTIFPEMVREPLRYSILGSAQKKGLIEVYLIDIRDYAQDRHRQVDDEPFGGGAGMVMKAAPIFGAVEDLKLKEGTRHILLSPQGEVFDQSKACELAAEEELLLLCGRYEGVDERVRTLFQEEISIGDYVLTGGEFPALVLIDAISRIIPGVLGKQDSFKEDSFFKGLLDYPHYTRPREFRGLKVPEVLLSGNHALIKDWRRREALKRTLLRRPDLLLTATLLPEDRDVLEQLREEKD